MSYVVKYSYVMSVNFPRGNNMRKMKLTKAIASTLVIASALALNPIGASAEWKENYIGQWYSEGDSWAVGWRKIEGNWYYFDEEGYMVKNRDIKGWYLNDKGIGTECIQAEGFDVDRATGTIGECIKGDVHFSPSSTKGVSLSIPEEIHGVKIKNIGYNVFDQCVNIESITLPESIESIGDYAFDNCIGLKSIVVPDNVISIGNGAFDGCVSLTNITLPKKISSINEKLFFCCKNLVSVTIPDNVTKIGNYAFYNCYSLKSITISDKVTEIGSGAFDSCYNLKSITISDKVTEIRHGAFWGCKEAVFYVGNEKIKQLILDSESNIDSNKIVVKK